MENQEEIIKGCLKGERQAQTKLYKSVAPKMFALCLRYAKDETEAEDILQDGFIKIFTCLSSYKSEGNFEGWMRRIFVNTALDRFRKKNPLYSVGEVYEVAKNATYNNSEDNMAVEELMELVHKLPAGYKMVFNLFAIEGYSHKEISDSLGISEGTSKSQLARARIMLRAEIEKIQNYGIKRRIGS